MIKVYLDIETTGLSIYTASILSMGMACYLMDEKLGEWETYIHNSSDFPLTSTKTHGIYPINYPRDEPSKLQDAPSLRDANILAWQFLTETRQKIQARDDSKSVVLHIITWNGNTFDVPMWILNTDELAGKPGAWMDTFGKIISAFSDYKNVTANLGSILCIQWL